MAVLFGGIKEKLMSRKQYNKLVVAATKRFLKQGGDSPTLLQEVISEVFGEEIPPSAGNDVLTLCRQVALAAKS